MARKGRKMFEIIDVGDKKAQKCLMCKGRYLSGRLDHKQRERDYVSPIFQDNESLIEPHHGLKRHLEMAHGIKLP